VECSKDLALTVIGQVIPTFDQDRAKIPFGDLGIDSFDMIALRVSLEQQVGPIPDETWVDFKHFQDLLDYCASL